jgi:hypothetical protein
VTGYLHPDGCVGCQRLRTTRAYAFEWQERFVMRLCMACFLALMLARPLRRLRTLF